MVLFCLLDPEPTEEVFANEEPVPLDTTPVSAGGLTLEDMEDTAVSPTLSSNEARKRPREVSPEPSMMMTMTRRTRDTSPAPLMKSWIGRCLPSSRSASSTPTPPLPRRSFTTPTPTSCTILPPPRRSFSPPRRRSPTPTFPLPHPSPPPHMYQDKCQGPDLTSAHSSPCQNALSQK